MKLPSALLDRLFDVIDALFDAFGSILRALLRGAFAPDARTWRGPRYESLAPRDVLVQEISLNAADAEQARKAIRLDPERHLPLSLSAAQFDVAGPIDEAQRLRSRPERNFLVATIRNDVLAQRRSEGRRSKSAEAFIFRPAEHPTLAFAFIDAPGARRRRFRRGILALALVALIGTAVDLSDAWNRSIETAMMQVESERLHAERRVRLAERALERENAAQTENQAPAIPLAQAQRLLSLLANRLPTESELSDLELRGHTLILKGTSSEPALLELELRRSFESAAIQFSASSDARPAPFEAHIALEAVASEEAQP